MKISQFSINKFGGKNFRAKVIISACLKTKRFYEPRFFCEENEIFYFFTRWDLGRDFPLVCHDRAPSALFLRFGCRLLHRGATFSPWLSHFLFLVESFTFTVSVFNLKLVNRCKIRAFLYQENFRFLRNQSEHGCCRCGAATSGREQYFWKRYNVGGIIVIYLLMRISCFVDCRWNCWKFDRRGWEGGSTTASSRWGRFGWPWPKTVLCS